MIRWRVSKIEILIDKFHIFLRIMCLVAAVMSGLATIIVFWTFIFLEALSWLKTGNWWNNNSWHILGLKEIINVPENYLDGWIGAQKILELFLNTPIPIIIIILGVIFSRIFYKLSYFVDPPSAN
jgi:hypothetical protein